MGDRLFDSFRIKNLSPDSLSPSPLILVRAKALIIKILYPPPFRANSIDVLIPRALSWAKFSLALQAGIMISNCKYLLCKSLF